jgi:hypothetical protein
MVDDKTSSQIGFAKWIIDHNQSLINLVDTKAGVILAADGAILAILGSFLSVNSIYERIFLWATLLLVLSSAVSGFMVIKPRTIACTPSTNIFFKSILTKSREDYRKDFAGSPDQILEDCLNNIYTLSIIQKAKFAFLKVSLYCLLVGLFPLIAMIVLQHM